MELSVDVLQPPIDAEQEAMSYAAVQEQLGTSPDLEFDDISETPSPVARGRDQRRQQHAGHGGAQGRRRGADAPAKVVFSLGGRAAANADGGSDGGAEDAGGGGGGGDGADDEEGDLFAKVEVKPPQQKSGLSSFFQECRVMRISVPNEFKPTAELQTFDIRCPQTTTVEHLTKMAITEYNSRNSMAPLDANGALFEMRVAEDDGTVDDSYAALPREEELVDVMFDALVLVRRKSTARRGSVLQSGVVQRVLLQVHVQEDQATGMKEMKLTLDVASGMTFRDMLVMVGRKIGRPLPAERWFFQRFAEQGAERESHSPSTAPELSISLDAVVAATFGSDLMTAGQFEQVQLCMKRFADEPQVVRRKPKLPPSEVKEGEAGAETARGDESKMILFSDLTASQYKEYSVYKVKKGSKKEERVMGIDRERIYNILPRKQDERSSDSRMSAADTALGFVKAAFKPTLETKNPMHMIRDVREIQTDEVRDKAFRITYINNSQAVAQGHWTLAFSGEQDEVTYEFEAKNAQERAEIVAKVSFLMSMADKSRNRSATVGVGANKASPALQTKTGRRGSIVGGAPLMGGAGRVTSRTPAIKEER